LSFPREEEEVSEEEDLEEREEAEVLLPGGVSTGSWSRGFLPREVGRTSRIT